MDELPHFEEYPEDEPTTAEATEVACGEGHPELEQLERVPLAGDEPS